MEKVENGLFVKMDYTGSLGNGQVFDSSQGKQPIEVQVGAGQLIKGFEKELLGMSLNEKKTFTVSPEDAYGEKDPNRSRTFPRKDMTSDIEPQVGQMVTLGAPDGRQMPAQITEVTDKSVTLDLNHPLAGQTLTFEIEVLGISKEATMASGGCNCSSSQQAGCGCDGDCSTGCGS